MYHFSVWNQPVAPGKRVRVVPETDIHVTSVTFGDIAEETGRTTVKLFRCEIPNDNEEDEENEEDEPELKFEKEPVILGHLTPGKIETQVLDLLLAEKEPFELEITGKNSIHLVGNYVEQQLPTNPFSDMSDDEDEDDEDESDEEAYGLDEVSSDVAIDPRDIVMGDSDDEDSDDDEAPNATITEVVEVKEEKHKKRARESDVAEEKKDKRDKKKKLKNEDGAAAPAPEIKEETKAEKKDKKEKKKEEKSDNTKTTKSGVKVDVRKPGSGPGAKIGQRLDMRYIGKLTNGTVFDKNIKGKPFSFVLGKGEVIKGWDEGLVGMAVGSEAILTVPPQAGYGKQKMDGIPPNSTLTFEVKLLKIK